METRSLDDFSLTLPEKKKKTFLKFSHEFPAFWPLVIHLELSENSERFAAFFHNKIVILVPHLEYVMNEITAGSIFILLTTDALYCICIRERHIARLHQLFWSS